MNSTAPDHFIPALPTLDPALLAPTISSPRASQFPLDRVHTPDVHLFYLARAAIFHAVRHLLERGEGTVLMPAYHHGVEVEAVRAAGAKVRFYRVDEHMQIDLEDLAKKAAADDVRALYVTHFVGFAQPIAEIAALAKRLDLRLIEDCALGLWSCAADGRPLGTSGDAAIFCLYKSLPVPHGGLLVAHDVPEPEASAPPLLSTLHHAAGLMLAHVELHGDEFARALLRFARAAAHRTIDTVVTPLQTGTMHLRASELAVGLSRWVERLLPRFDPYMVAVIRRRNFSHLVKALGDDRAIIGASLPAGTCPLFVPLRVPDKRAALRALATHGIEAVNFWEAGDPECDADEFPEVTRMRREVLELPCHQSLDDEAIDYLARTVKQVLAHA